MKLIENKNFDEERALYRANDIKIVNCSFEGPAHGESPLKEAKGIQAENCTFKLKYPFWHNKNLIISNSEVSESGSDAIWYTENVSISNTKLYGVRSLRECSEINISGCDINSGCFGWYSSNIAMESTTVQGGYFMMQSSDLKFKDVSLNGDYSLQYIENAIFDECTLMTNDTLWHSKNVTVKESLIKGNNIGWYSDGLTLINCVIFGKQPLCCCKNLRLINCELHDTYMCFENSDITAEITTHVESIRNPHSGMILVPSVGEIIMDDEEAKCKINVLT